MKFWNIAENWLFSTPCKFHMNRLTGYDFIANIKVWSLIKLTVYMGGVELICVVCSLREMSPGYLVLDNFRAYPGSTQTPAKHLARQRGATGRQLCRQLSIERFCI